MILLIVAGLPAVLPAQHHDHHPAAPAVTGKMEVQPLLAQTARLQEALRFLGSALSPADEQRLEALRRQPHRPAVIPQVQEVLDPYCLAVVTINPEGRVSVVRGAAKAKLMQGGWTSFLVKVYNQAGATAPLLVESPNALLPRHGSSGSPQVRQEDIVTPGEVANRFLDAQMYDRPPLSAGLSGLGLEYAVVQLYSRDAGAREVALGFNTGQGSQDIGFRHAIHVLFEISPAVRVTLDVKEEDGTPAMASFVITDSIVRTPGRLSAVYPLPSRRVPAYDEYPDFFFQPQIYRADGEQVLLAPGSYQVTYTRGPEYIPQTKQITIPPGVDTVRLQFRLRRWIDMAGLGWYSADHHVHAAGCSHYDSPEEGVPPRDMWRQVLGEDLGVASVLTWGPSWYHQKQYFTGRDDSLSTQKNIMRYDVEVSGFPSSHAGHVVLLRIQEDDYPGTHSIEEWPSWTLPVLQWARQQGGVTGYAHSGWGLMPVKPTDELPNYELPKMDYIGANEYIVTVAKGAVDFYSAGDTPAPWELNMWYHTLNCGFRPRLAGETDFPCITDARIGQARSYYKAGKSGKPDYDEFVEALQLGRSYVSDGGSHLMNFTVNGLEAGTGNSELHLKGTQELTVTADVAAYLPEQPTTAAADISQKSLTGQPYWHVERARMPGTRNIRVELIANGKPVDTAVVAADGKPRQVRFRYRANGSVWLALRVYASSHSNPVFVIMDEKPIAEAKSAEWCIRALDQCWKMKAPNIRESERAEAKKAYDEARIIFQNINGEISKKQSNGKKRKR